MLHIPFFFGPVRCGKLFGVAGVASFNGMAFQTRGYVRAVHIHVHFHIIFRMNFRCQPLVAGEAESRLMAFHARLDVACRGAALLAGYLAAVLGQPVAFVMQLAHALVAIFAVSFRMAGGA